jgi:predicted SnoaL-like aldol condensation-catalyzing enzyme
MNQQNERLARRWFQEVWNERRQATIDELTPPGLIGHHDLTTSHSREDFKRFHAELLELIPDIQVAVEDVLAIDTDAVVRWRFSGTNRFNNEPIVFRGCSWLKVADGQFTEGWDCWNPAPLLELRASARADGAPAN